MKRISSLTSRGHLRWLQDTQPSQNLENVNIFYNLTFVCVADDEHHWYTTGIPNQVIKPACNTHLMGIIVDCRTPPTLPEGVKFGDFNPDLEIEPMASMIFRAEDYKGPEKQHDLRAL